MMASGVPGRCKTNHANVEKNQRVFAPAGSSIKTRDEKNAWWLAFFGNSHLRITLKGE